MFGWAIVCLIVAIAAAVLGLGGLAGNLIIFVAGLVLFVVLILDGRPPFS
jgi:uncharacterized membrane protein YtjA (UPF0391 family)